MPRSAGAEPDVQPRGEGPSIRFVDVGEEDPLDVADDEVDELLGTGSRDRARERLYVGMSRATDELVVAGDRTPGGGRRRGATPGV